MSHDCLQLTAKPVMAGISAHEAEKATGQSSPVAMPDHGDSGGVLKDVETASGVQGLGKGGSPGRRRVGSKVPGY